MRPHATAALSVARWWHARCSSRSPSRPAYRTVRWSAAAPPTERRTGIAPIPLHEKLSLALADRYRIERELGVGGMATVHLAHDLKHDRAVAIKVLKPDLAESLGRERFVREIRLAARLTHPHILPLYDSGEADGFLFYVMPVMQGLTLRQRMETNGALPVEEAVRIVSEVADALDYAHRNDIIHRDIKPENILLHEGHAVVADFGIGKAMIAAAAESTTFTQVGIAIGTPAYMSPEQASGDAVDGRADLFALGCIFYEMLTGEHPFTGPTLQAVIAKRFHHVPPPVMASRPAVPERVSRTVERLLEREPVARLSSGATVVRALRGEVELAARREAPSIAVLPFANMSSNADNVFFSDGITDDIIGALTRVPGLKVAARASAFTFRSADVDLATVGERLGVRHVLQGSVRRAGNRVRVTAQLMTAGSGTQQWSERWDRDLDDIFAIQDEIARAIVGQLEAVLGLKAPDAPMVVRPTYDIEAYELFLRGRDAVRRRTPTSVRLGLALLRSVVERDPGFALAWLGLAEAYAALGVYGYEPMSNCQRGGEEALTHAVSAGASAGDVARYRAMVKLYLRSDWPTAAADLEIALAANPNDPLANLLSALWHRMAGNMAPRSAAVVRLLTADPLSPWAHAMAGHAYFFTGDYKEALECHERAIALETNTLNALWGSGLVLLHLGRAEAAILRLRRAVEVGERSPTTVALLSYGLYRIGQVSEARALGEEVARQAQDHAFWELLFAVGAGDDARLGAALRDAVARQAGCISLGTTIKPELEALLDHPVHGPVVRQLSVFANLAPVARAQEVG
ncbi:MAG: protein kinase [Gemmatimonadaceae bacterium]|nr:protein kinase [Gemmatimonadaceae bacterium]